MSSNREQTEDIRNKLAEFRARQESDINALILRAQNVEFEGLDFTTKGVNVIEYVNVSTSIGAAQGASTPTGDTTPPAQVTVLTITNPTQSNLSLSWTASGASDLDYYNVYRSTTSGFTVTVGVTVPVAQPELNSFIDNTLSPGITYYYKVSAVDTSGNIGTPSSQASGSTTQLPAFTRNLWLELNNSYADSSGSNLVVTNNNTNFATPGRFGSHYVEINPSGTSIGNSSSDYLRIANNTNIQLDFSIGFSISFWVNSYAWPGGLLYIGVLIHKCDSTTSPTSANYSVEMNANGNLVFTVQRSGIIYKASKSAIANNVWYHVVCTFDAQTNTPKIYVNNVVGATSTTTIRGQWGRSSSLYIGKHPDDNVTGGDSYLWGAMDEIQYFKGIVLTATQVTNLMNTNSPGTGADVTAPAQTVGLAVSTPTQTTLSLSWTASVATDLHHYNVYRSTTSGFTVTLGVTSPVGTPTGNSFIDTTLTPNTTYYYKVSAVDISGNIGAVSTQATGTTTSTSRVSESTTFIYNVGSRSNASLWLPFEGDVLDASGLANTVTNTGGLFSNIAKFGNQSLSLNEAAAGTDRVSVTSNSNTDMETSTAGMSFSFWIYPTANPSSGLGYIAVKRTPIGGDFSDYAIWRSSDGAIHAQIYNDGAFTPAQTHGVRSSLGSAPLNTWTHVALVYNGGGWKCHINKVDQAVTDPIPDYAYANFSTLTIGNVDNNAVGYDDQWGFRGRIDEFQYFKGTQLIQSQIDNLFSSNTVTAVTLIPNMILPFDNTVNDSSTYANTVTNFSGTFTTSSKFGTHSFLINPSVEGTQRCVVTHSTSVDIDVVNGFSWSFWIYPLAETSNSGYILGKQSATGDRLIVQRLSQSGGTLLATAFNVPKLAWHDNSSTFGGVPLNTWSHIVLVYNGSGWKVYVNKVDQTVAVTVNRGSINSTTGTAIQIGNSDVAGTGAQAGLGFRGRIDDMFYFKGVQLTQTQINNLYDFNHT